MIYFYISGIYSSSGIDSAPFSIFILIILIFSAILGSLMYYFALIELEDEKGKNILYAGIFTSICISIITSAYISGLIVEIFGTIPYIYGNPYFSSYQNFAGIGILSLIPGILFIFALYIPYDRIKKGELIPQVLSIYIPTYSSNIPGRFCPNCGRQIPNDSFLCPYCGKNLK